MRLDGEEVYFDETDRDSQILLVLGHELDETGPFSISRIQAAALGRLSFLSVERQLGDSSQATLDEIALVRAVHAQLDAYLECTVGLDQKAASFGG